MAFREIKSQLGRSASTPSVLDAGKTSLIGPSEVQEKPNETEEGHLEEMIRQMEEEDRKFQEGQKQTKGKRKGKKKNGKNPAEEKCFAEASAGSGHQNVNRSQTATSSAGPRTNNSRRLNFENQSKPKSDDFWDGCITDQPPFPLSELIALHHCSFSAHFYAYARRNGRAGFIKKDLIEGILENSPKNALDDTAMMTTIQPEPKVDRAESEVRESKDNGKSPERKDPRATTIQKATADSNPANETETAGTMVEIFRETLRTYMEGIDPLWSTRSAMHQMELCIETIRAVKERVDQRDRYPLIRHHMAAAATSLSSTPSPIDPKAQSAVPRPPIWNGESFSLRLPSVAYRNNTGPKKSASSPITRTKSMEEVKTDWFGVYNEDFDTENKELKRSRQEWKKDAIQHDDDDDQGFMSYSRAAKAAARYYALTSAYSQPFQRS